MKTPPDDVADRIFDLRCKCKRGEKITGKELNYCAKILEQYPEWYGSLDEAVFEATKPFGAK